MSKYFSGQSQGSYLPPGFMQTATQPGQYYAAALASVGKSIGEGIRRRGEKKKDDAYKEQIQDAANGKKPSSDGKPALKDPKEQKKADDVEKLAKENG